MDISMRLFVVASLLLFVSMVTDMGSLLVVDAESAPVCNPRRCDRACGKMGLFGCCRGVNRPECYCRHRPGCPRSGFPLVINDVKDEVCDRERCGEHCNSEGWKFGCCAGYPGTCTCSNTPACPLYVTVEITENEDVAERPLVINDVKDKVCDREHCGEHCKSKGKFGCCAGYPGRCTCRDTPACPLYATMEITENEDVAVKKSIA